MAAIVQQSARCFNYSKTLAQSTAAPGMDQEWYRESVTFHVCKYGERTDAHRVQT